MKTTNTNNRKFWNEYVAYWESKSEEANTGKDVKDKTYDDTMYKGYFHQLMKYNAKGSILDFGCGSGRLYDIIRGGDLYRKNRYIGIDISSVCLEHMVINSDLQIGKDLFSYDGENIPFKDLAFNNIICMGVFDCCDQEHILKELLRVLAYDGTLLISGKNNLYNANDEPAYIAEINARKKEHPNSFTNVVNMNEQLKKNGYLIKEQYYFLRREDYALNKYVNEIPEKFYQWILIIKKTKNSRSDFEFQQFSDIFSDTFLNEGRL